ncbi:uncharacterized protein LOC132405174 [Hypanus sabinus]|uniref:uncharacterized protein LOC132405174 n=1 Tax=Hypanus sabinus TaxID=79690 RepID=UPI0028C4BAB5|nr:uncharacterized protein LOC132405174 [Hypanus sabinus]
MRSHSGSWNGYWYNDWKGNDLYQEQRLEYDSINLIIICSKFKFAGMFTLTQTQPMKKILQQYEVFGIKVEASPQRPVEGSDVTLSCTISRLPDTVSLHWNPVGSSQQNRRNTDQIRLNNTVYLMLRHVTVEDGELYQCEVRENGNIVFTSKANFTVDTEDHGFKHTIVVITGGLAFLFIIILVMVLCLRKRKITALGNPKQKSQQTMRNTEDDSNLYASPNEIQSIEGTNEMPETETSHIAEYMSVSRKAIQRDTQKNIHYASICFEKNAPEPAFFK